MAIVHPGISLHDIMTKITPLTNSQGRKHVFPEPHSWCVAGGWHSKHRREVPGVCVGPTNWEHPGGAGLGIMTLLGWLKPMARCMSEVRVKASENPIIHVGARARETRKVAGR